MSGEDVGVTVLLAAVEWFRCEQSVFNIVRMAKGSVRPRLQGVVVSENCLSFRRMH